MARSTPPTRERPLSRKALHEALTSELAEHDAEALREAIHGLADAWAPGERAVGLATLRASLQGNRPGAGVEDLEATVERLGAAVEARLAELQEEPLDAYADEEDGSPLDDLAPDALEVLAGAARALEQGDPSRARQVYARVFDLLTAEDEFGRGFGAAVFDVHGAFGGRVDSDGLDEHLAHWLRAVYLDTPAEHRAGAVIAAAREMHSLGLHPVPGLDALAHSARDGLPAWSSFLEGVASKLAASQDALGDAWLRHATLELRGVDGLAALARQQGAARPQAWVDWIRTAVAAGDDAQALAACREADAVLPRHAPIRAELADVALSAAEHARDAEAIEHLTLEACLADPCAVRLAAIVEAARGADDAQRRLGVALERLQAPRATATRSQSLKQQGMPPPAQGTAAPSVPAAIIALAALLAGDRAAAMSLADGQRVLGWSGHDNAQPMVVGYTLVALAGGDPDRLPPNTRWIWRAALYNVTLGHSLTWDEHNAWTAARCRVDAAARQSIAHAPWSDEAAQEALTWCTRIVWRRAAQIVERKHRGAYERAAIAAAACMEAGRAGGLESVTTPMIERLRSAYPRHSAFQRALREALAATTE